MFERCLLAIVAVLLLPAGAGAQYGEPTPTPRISITPVAGYRLPYTATGEMSLFYRDGSISYLESREQRGGGVVVGAQAEIRLFGPIGLSASFLHAESAENQVEQLFLTEDLEVEWAGPTRGPTVQFFRAGLVLTLAERSPELQRLPIEAALSLGPALVREVQLADPVPPDFPQANPVQWDPVHHYAVSVGAHVTVPLGSPHFALRFGAEDYFTFWNEAALNRQTERFYGGVADWSYGRHHLLLLQAGLSLRF